MGRKVVSIGDLHGDFVAAVRALRIAGAIATPSGGQELGDPYLWKGGSMILVVLGDIVDRGDNSREIFELLFYLQDQAQHHLHGGDVVIIMGNHEQLRLVGPVECDGLSSLQLASFC